MVVARRLGGRPELTRLHNLVGKWAGNQPGNGDWTRDKDEALAVWASRGYETNTGTGSR